MISEELSLIRYYDGIKLEHSYSSCNHPRVGSLLALPFCVYFSNSQNTILCTNEKNVESCGFDSVHDAMGKTLKTVFTSESTNSIVQNDLLVMKTRQCQILEEHALRHDGLGVDALVIKFPWYDEADQIKGIFGCSIVGDSFVSLAKSLTIIRDLGLLNNHEIDTPTPLYSINAVQLSKREYECLHYTIRGKSAKQIAYHLKLSPRTVEEYLTKVKNKMGVYSKNELIEKTIDYLMHK